MASSSGTNNSEVPNDWPSERTPPPPVPFINVVEALPETPLPNQLPRYGPLIPGTEAFQNVQVARRRKLYHEASSSFDPQQPIMTTQMFYNELVAEGDPDFNEVRWTSAVQYIAESGEEWTKLNEIHVSRSLWRKVSKVLVMIKDLKKNESGDGMGTVKDPTGTMGVSIHHKVFEMDGVNQVLKIGAVVLLRKVCVARGDRRELFLNITVNNIVKVIGKNQMIAPMIILDSEDEMN